MGWNLLVVAMKRFNVNKVLLDAEAERQKPKPLPKIRIKKKSDTAIFARLEGGDHHPMNDLYLINEPTGPIDASKLGYKIISTEEDNTLLYQLEREYADIRMERNKLSSQISIMVEGGATQEALKELYHKIEGYRGALQSHYDKIKYVKQHGQLPEIKSDAQSEETLFELKDKKRRLIDKRCKLQSKLKVSAKPSKPVQIATWELELEQANAEYNDVEKRIKKMEGRA